MVPYLTKKAMPITDTYTVPKNTMLIPSFWNSLHDETIYPSPDLLIPERWMEDSPDGLANANPKNYLVFGAGAHKCIAVDYVNMHISAVIGTASVLMNWEHVLTEESEEVQVIATIFPKDGFVAKFEKRVEA